MADDDHVGEICVLFGPHNFRLMNRPNLAEGNGVIRQNHPAVLEERFRHWVKKRVLGLQVANAKHEHAYVLVNG